MSGRSVLMNICPHESLKNSLILSASFLKIGPPIGLRGQERGRKPRREVEHEKSLGPGTERWIES